MFWPPYPEHIAIFAVGRSAIDPPPRPKAAGADAKFYRGAEPDAVVGRLAGRAIYCDRQLPTGLTVSAVGFPPRTAASMPGGRLFALRQPPGREGGSAFAFVSRPGDRGLRQGRDCVACGGRGSMSGVGGWSYRSGG